MTTAEVREARRRRREAALALRGEMSPTGPAPDHFRVATWNVNSLRARTAALGRFLERAQPDVVLLQETKSAEVSAAVLGAGLVDLDALRWGPRDRRFTWWAHGIRYERNLGMRIDLLASDRALAERLETTWIDHLERGSERSSDHAALIADFRRD